MYYGTLLFSSVPYGHIKTVNFPDLDERFVTILASDIPGENLIKAFDGAMPLLAENVVTFPHEPIGAIFGPSKEVVTLAAKETKIVIEEADDSPELPLLPEVMSLSWGSEISEEKKAGLKEVTTIVRSASVLSDTSIQTSVEVWIEHDTINVIAPCQWAEMIKKNVASVVGVPQKNVTVHQLPCYKERDEYLFLPTLLASVAAIFVIKSEQPCVVFSNLYTSSPAYIIKRTTLCTTAGIPVAETATLTADQGAYLFASEELQKQALAGLIPNYPLERFEASAAVVSSHLPPSSFFAGLGYDDALASSELQATRIAETFNINPNQWRGLVGKERRRFTDYVPSFDLPSLVVLSDEVSQKSDFNRKWASYEGQKGDMSIVPYARGIGIASGVSVSGFSTSHAKKDSYHVQVSLSEKGSLTISSSLQTEGVSDRLIKTLLTPELNLGDEHSVFIIDRENLGCDSGPDVLFRSGGKLPRQLLSACRKLFLQKKGKTLPITELVDIDDKFYPCEFENEGAVAVVVETRTDRITYKPSVTGVWISATVGNIFDEKRLRENLRRIALTTLQDCGAVFLTTDKTPFTVDISLRTDNTEVVDSLDEAVRGLTKAAFVASVHQYAPKLQVGWPITAEACEVTLLSKGGEK